MSDSDNGRSHLFEAEVALPDRYFDELGRRLVGFGDRYERLHRDLRLVLDADGLMGWSQQYYQRRLPLLGALTDRYPLVILHGDVGTGKTATAEAAASALSGELDREARLYKLSTRVRGTGTVGQMSSLIGEAFALITREAGKRRLAFLVIDEGDSLAGSRSASQSHHEDKVAVNTLIQHIDDIRRYNGRIVVFLCTNRFDALDPAIVRRAARIEAFQRPDDRERELLLRMDCDGLGLTDETFAELVDLTGADANGGVGYSFADIRTRLLPDALARAYPERQLAAEDLVEVARTLEPSPSILNGGVDGRS